MHGPGRRPSRLAALAPQGDGNRIKAKAMAVNERFDFSGRSVVITGGGKGIGKVYAEEFAKVGARVVAADIDAVAAENVAAALRQAGFEALRPRGASASG